MQDLFKLEVFYDLYMLKRAYFVSIVGNGAVAIDT